MSSQNNNDVEYFDIISNNIVKIWFSMLAEKEPLVLINLISDNNDKLIEIFGEPNQKDKNNNCNIWNIRNQGIKFIIKYDIKEKTTNYFVMYQNSTKSTKNNEVFQLDDKIGSALVMFLKELTYEFSQ